VIDLGEALEQESRRFVQEPGARQRLDRRRDRRVRNRRIGAALLAISISVATVGALVLGYRRAEMPAHSPPQAQSGRIAFARSQTRPGEGEGVVYTADPDGSDVRLLPGSDSWQPNPRWSPDGRHIAVNEPKTPAPGCPTGVVCSAVVVDVDTGSYRGVPWRMPGDWGVDCYPWSPDGTRLLCGAGDYNGTGSSGIYTLGAADGSDPTLITRCNECAPGGFSPDGRRVVFADTAPDGEVGMFVVNIDGTGRHRVTPKGLLLNGIDGGSWSSAEDRIVFQARRPGQNWSVWVVDPDGNDLHELPIGGCGGALADAGSAACRLPAWSPDGTTIVFVRRTAVRTAVAGIYSVNADGSGLFQIPNTGPGDNQPAWGTHPPSSG
jgi:Tol biopolymer transport system component